MRRNAFPPKNRRRKQIAWPPKRRFGCGVGSVGLKAPSFKDTAQKRWNREAKAADRADHRWRHEEAAAAAVTGKLQELAVSEGTRAVHKFAEWVPPTNGIAAH